MDWILLAQDRERWQALVNAVTNLQVSWNSASYLTSWSVTTFLTMFHGNFDYNLLWAGFIFSGSKRFDQSATQNKTSVKSVPWQTAENSNGIEKGRKLLLFQSPSRSHFFTTSVPHSLVQPRTHSSVPSQTQSSAHSIPDPEIPSPDSFIHSVHSLPHSATPSLTFHSIHKYILSLLHSATP
jgi:hypothetical protein